MLLCSDRSEVDSFGAWTLRHLGVLIDLGSILLEHLGALTNLGLVFLEHGH